MMLVVPVTNLLSSHPDSCNGEWTRGLVFVHATGTFQIGPCSANLRRDSQGIPARVGHLRLHVCLTSRSAEFIGGAILPLRSAIGAACSDLVPHWLPEGEKTIHSLNKVDVVIQRASHLCLTPVPSDMQVWLESGRCPIP